MIKIAINGFGRIGRPALKRILDNHPDLEIVAINDLTTPETLAHLLKYDSVYGTYQKEISHTENSLIINGKEIKIFTEKEPENLPWGKLNIDIVLECTGRFTDFKGAGKHITAGAKKVIISAPCCNEEMPTYVLGVNEKKYNPEIDNIISMASCTTNCLAPIAKIIHENFIIEKALMTTVHAYTNDQRILDLPHQDLRRARAAGLSIIPTTTGAALAVTQTIPELKGKFHGVSLRVPVPVVSICDMVAHIKNQTSAEEINLILKKSTENELRGILAYEEKPLVSIDYKGNTNSAIIDAPSTMVIEKNLIKILAWYDNEWGYACRLAEMAEYMGNKL